MKKVPRRLTLPDPLYSKCIKLVGKSDSLSVGLSTDKDQVERLSNVVWPTNLMKVELPARVRPEDFNVGLCKGEGKDMIAELCGKTQKRRFGVALGAEGKGQCKSPSSVIAGSSHSIAIAL